MISNQRTALMLLLIFCTHLTYADDTGRTASASTDKPYCERTSNKTISFEDNLQKALFSDLIFGWDNNVRRDSTDRGAGFVAAEASWEPRAFVGRRKLSLLSADVGVEALATDDDDEAYAWDLGLAFDWNGNKPDDRWSLGVDRTSQSLNSETLGSATTLLAGYGFGTHEYSLCYRREQRVILRHTISSDQLTQETSPYNTDGRTTELEFSFGSVIAPKGIAKFAECNSRAFCVARPLFDPLQARDAKSYNISLFLGSTDTRGNENDGQYIGISGSLVVPFGHMGYKALEEQDIEIPEGYTKPNPSFIDSVGLIAAYRHSNFEHSTSLSSVLRNDNFFSSYGWIDFRLSRSGRTLGSISLASPRLRIALELERLDSDAFEYEYSRQAVTVGLVWQPLIGRKLPNVPGGPGAAIAGTSDKPKSLPKLPPVQVNDEGSS